MPGVHAESGVGRRDAGDDGEFLSALLGPIDADAAVLAFAAFEAFVKSLPPDSLTYDRLYVRAQSLTEELEDRLSGTRPETCDG